MSNERLQPMKAATIARDGSFTLAEHFDPAAADGMAVIDVRAAGIGPTDLMRAKGFFGPVTGVYVPGGEGTGLLADGTRVYFGHSAAPFGAIAEKTLVPVSEVWSFPPQLADDLVIGLAISGIGALIPMEEAQIRQGDNVLILGATGPVGQIALQLAKILGAGHVVAAARSAEKLAQLVARGWADDTVQLGTSDDEAALKTASNGGFDVVLDVIYGPPAEAAMRATRPGARMMSIGVQAGPTVTLSLRDLVFRSHVGVGTGQRPATERQAAFNRLMALATDKGLSVDTAVYAFDRADEAWAAQAVSPHAKIIIQH